jgi:hypothetical protein
MTQQPDQTKDYPVVRQLAVGVNVIEDRLVMIATTKNGDRLAALLTRRLMRNLLDKYADVLADTSARVSQAAAGQRDEVLQMEHVSALAAGQADAGQGTQGDQAPAPSAGYLITDGQFQAREQSLVLALDGVRRRPDGPDGTEREPVIGLMLDRTTAHQVLRLLTDKADEAGWDLPKPSAWTENIQQAKAGALN